MDILYTLRDRILQQSAVEKLRQKQQELGFETLVLVGKEGGVGYRHWQLEGNFGNPERCLSQEETINLFDDYASNLSTQLGVPVLYFLSFAYQAKTTGNWGPIPKGSEEQVEWSQDWVMPNAGMLHSIFDELHAWPAYDEMLFVSAFDYAQQAAENVEIPFQWARDFFAPPPPPFDDGPPPDYYEEPSEPIQFTPPHMYEES